MGNDKRMERSIVLNIEEGECLVRCSICCKSLVVFQDAIGLPEHDDKDGVYCRGSFKKISDAEQKIIDGPTSITKKWTD